MARLLPVLVCVALVTAAVPALAAPISSDLDGDGDIDNADLRLFVRFWHSFMSGGAWDPTYSLDGDALLDHDDAALMIRNYLIKPTPQSGTGTVHLPAGSPLSPSSLRIASSLGVSSVAGDGGFAASAPGPGYALVTVIDSQDRPVLCGFMDAAAPGETSLDAESTAAAMLYFAIGAFALPWDSQARALELIRESPQNSRLAEVLCQRLVVDPLAMASGDAAVDDAVAQAATDLVPYLLPRTEAVAASVRPSQVDTADGVVPASITVDPSTAQSGIVVAPSTTGNGITITNHFRRHTQYYLYRRGWEDQDGNYHTDQPWTKLVGPGVQDFCYLPATNGLSGALGTLVDLLVGGQVPYQAQSIPLVAINIEPADAKKVDLQAYLMGGGKGEIEQNLPAELRPPGFRDVWETTINNMGMLTFVQEYFLPVIFAMLPIDNYFKLSTGREMSSLAQSIMQVFTDHGFDFTEQIAKGEMRAATGTAVRVFADNATVRHRVIECLLKSGLLWGKVDDIAAKSTAKLASHLLLLDKLFTGADIAVVMTHLAMSRTIDTWAVTAVPPEVKVQPKPELTIARGETKGLFCTCGNVVGEKYFHWGSLSSRGVLTDSRGNSGQTIVTVDSQISYTAQDTAPLGSTDTVMCTVTYVSKGQTLTLGTDGTTVKIDANRIEILPVSAPVSRGGLRQLNCYVNGGSYPGDYHWKTSGKYGHLEDFSQGNSGTDFWSTDSSVKYIANINAPETGTDVVETEIYTYPGRHNYVGKTTRDINLTPARIVMSPQVLQAPGGWKSGGTSMEVIVEGDGFYGVWGPKFRYQWRCGAPWKLTDNKGTDSTSYFTDDVHTYPYPPASAKDGASSWVEATVYVEDKQGNLSPLGFVGGMAELRYSASFYMVSGGYMGEGIVRSNCQLNVSRHPLSHDGWNSATYWFRGLRTGDKLTLRMMVQSVPQGQQQALASAGPLYLYGSVMGADGKYVTRCDKISDGISKLLAYGETYTQIITIPAG